MTDERAKRISDLGTKLFTERKNVMTMRQEIAENFYPERADFFEDNIFNADFAAHLMDSSPVLTCQELANAIPAMTRPKSKKWFKQSTGDDELDERTDVSQFLERNSDIQRRQMYRRQSMLTRALRQKDRDWVTFGESVMSVEETKDRENLIYKTHHTRDIAFMDDENGITNHLHRKMKMTARNIVSKFGKDAEIHDSVRTAADKEPNKNIELVHVLLPAEEYDLSNNEQPFVSLYLDTDNCKVIKASPQPFFNYIVDRWQVVSGHVHGFSPATLVDLPDARYLQSLARIFLEQGEKAVDPPAIDASGMVDGEFNFQAGGVTFVDPDYDWRTGDAIQYLESRSNFTLGLEMRQDARNLLANAFFINKIFLPGEGEMTAFETQKRIEEFIRHASPIFEPVDDGNHELLNATYRALENMGKIRYSDMPHALVRHEDEEKIEISYQFENPIRDAEGRARVAQFQECYQIHAGAKEAGFDTGLKVGIAGRDAIRGTGAPAKWSTTEDEMERSTEKDEQVNALSEGAELIQQGSDAAVGAAEAAGALQQAGLA